jgi:hypothetical protein
MKCRMGIDGTTWIGFAPMRSYSRSCETGPLAAPDATPKLGTRFAPDPAMKFHETPMPRQNRAVRRLSGSLASGGRRLTRHQAAVTHDAILKELARLSVAVNGMLKPPLKVEGRTLTPRAGRGRRLLKRSL